jgi:hypothetical protein
MAASGPRRRVRAIVLLVVEDPERLAGLPVSVSLVNHKSAT